MPGSESDIGKSFDAADKLSAFPSGGGCSPINWLSQTKTNLTLEYMNLNFASATKLTLLYSFNA